MCSNQNFISNAHTFFMAYLTNKTTPTFANKLFKNLDT